jgi:type IV pilus assembly protein PilO
MPPYKEWPLWAQFGLSIAVAAVIFFVGWNYVPNIKNQNETIAQLEEKVADLQEQVRRGRILAAKEPQLRREIADLELKLEELKAIIPPLKDDAQLLDRLKSLADRSRLRINSIKWDRLRDQEFYREYPIKMDIEGTYHDLAIFFDRLSRESRIFNVGGLNMGVSRQGRFSIHASYTATTFVFKEETAESGGKPGQRRQG